MTYTFAQLEGLWIQAGGNRAIAPVMAAIALAESSGDPNAVNPTDNGGKQSSYGLWQISNGTHSPPASNWANPLENAKLAVAKLHSQGLGAWGTYTSGKYKDFLSSAAPTGTGQGSGTTAASRGSGGTSGTPSAANAASTKSGSGTTAGGLSGFFDAIWAGIQGGLTVSADSGSTTAGAIIGSQGLASSASDVAQAIATLVLPFTVLANFLDWFFVPSHWIRIACGAAGLGAVGIGVYELAHSGESRPAALPIGIGLAGGGAILLFIAFHNLDPSIKTVGELLADIQGKVQTDLQATTSPAAAVTAASGG